MAIDGIATRASINHSDQVVIYNERVLVEATPTLTVAGTYAAGDYVGVSGTFTTLSGCARYKGGTGKIESAVLIDYAMESETTELWLFDTAGTPPADNAAWDVTDANVRRCLGVIPFSTFYAGTANSVSQVLNVGLSFKAATADAALYGCLVTRGTPVYTSGDLTVRLMISQD